LQNGKPAPLHTEPGMKLPRLRPDEPGVGPRESEPRAPPPAPPEAAAGTPQIVAVRCEPGRVHDGRTAELFVDLAQPAPDDGVVVALSADWTGLSEPVATVTVQPGTTTGQTTLVVPSDTALGWYVIWAQAGASASRTQLLVVPVGTPMLVSFTITPDVVSWWTGGTLRMEVGLDRPAPAGGVVVRVTQVAGSPVVDVSVPAGSKSAFAHYHLGAFQWVPKDKRLKALFAGIELEAILHIKATSF
jgi:hypothetical protein